MLFNHEHDLQEKVNIAANPNMQATVNDLSRRVFIASSSFRRRASFVPGLTTPAKEHTIENNGWDMKSLSFLEMKIILIQMLLFLCATGIYARQLSAETDFEKANGLSWQISFEDDCMGEWQKKWVMDGERSYITHSAQGMDYYAGQEAYNDTCHTALWTKQKFSGDLKIEYDYTRLDTSSLGVNILYVLASGSGKGEYKTDLFDWNELRRVPAMRQYYNHVNTYHISYAAFSFESGEPEYIRARRYMPETGQGLDGTALTPEYENSALFATGVKHHIIVIRRGERLYMHVSNPSQTQLFWFDTSNFPTIKSGRVGLRQMWTRASRYANFKISELK